MMTGGNDGGSKIRGRTHINGEKTWVRSQEMMAGGNDGGCGK